MTLSIKAQIENAKRKLTDEQVNDIIAKGQTFPEKTRDKRTLDMLKIAVQRIPKKHVKASLAPTPTEVPMPSGDAGPSTEKSPVVPAEKPTKKQRDGAPTKKDKAVKTPPQSRTLVPVSKAALKGGIAVVRRGETGGMDFKNTVLNGIKAAEKAGVKKVTSDDIKKQFEKHGVEMDDNKLRMSLGNLARDARIKRLGHGVYKSL